MAPSPELSLREPAGPHRCPGCPDGATVDPERLLARDRVARCFIESCRVKDEARPEAARMRSPAEWEGFLRDLCRRRLLGPPRDAGSAELVTLLAAEPPPFEERFEVDIDLSEHPGLGVDLDQATLEVREIQADGGVAAWNRARPWRSVRSGDRAVEASGRRSAAEILALCRRQARAAEIRGRGDVKITFLRGGLDVCGFQRWLVQRTHGESRLNCDVAAEALHAALRGVHGSIRLRGLESLGRRELYNYQVLLSECEHGVVDALERCLDQVRSAEKAEGGVYGLGLLDAAGSAAPAPEAGGVEGQAPPPLKTTPEDFQWAHGPEIERRLRSDRLPGVALPLDAPVLESTGWGLRRLLGRTAEGQEVEVLEVPWEVSAEHADLAELLANRLEALQQLALSPYFPAYLGCDLSSYSGVGLHFLQRKRGVCLRQLVADMGPLAEGNPLLAYWAREMLAGLSHYLCQCCQELTEDVALGHVYVDLEGTQVVFQGLPFGERRGVLQDDLPEFGPRCKWRNSADVCEARLVTMFGEMLLELLCGEQPRGEALGMGACKVSPEMRSLLSHALNARDTADHRQGLFPSGAVAADPSADTELEAVERAAIGLGGGLVAAGLDEYLPVEEGLRLWWTRPPKAAPALAPNPEGSADAGGAELAEDWGDAVSTRLLRGREDAADAAGHARPPELGWEPNVEAVTLQQLCEHPLLARRAGEDMAELFEAWDSLYTGRGRWSAGTRPSAQRQRLERFLDGERVGPPEGGRP